MHNPVVAPAIDVRRGGRNLIFFFGCAILASKFRAIIPTSVTMLTELMRYYASRETQCCCDCSTTEVIVVHSVSLKYQLDPYEVANRSNR